MAVLVNLDITQNLVLLQLLVSLRSAMPIKVRGVPGVRALLEVSVDHTVNVKRLKQVYVLLRQSDNNELYISVTSFNHIR